MAKRKATPSPFEGLDVKEATKCSCCGKVTTADDKEETTTIVKCAYCEEHLETKTERMLILEGEFKMVEDSLVISTFKGKFAFCGTDCLERFVESKLDE